MAAKLSQQALGDLVGVTKVTISDLERGEMRLDTGYMRRIAKALKVTAADILLPDDNPYSLEDDERQLIELYRSATDEQRDQLRRVSEAIVPFRQKADKVA